MFSAADTVIPAAGTSSAIAGVAGHDAASGAPVTVFAGDRDHPRDADHRSGGARSAALIQSAAAGAVTGGAAAGAEIGTAVRAVSAAGGVLRWKTTRG